MSTFDETPTTVNTRQFSSFFSIHQSTLIHITTSSTPFVSTPTIGNTVGGSMPPNPPQGTPIIQEQYLNLMVQYQTMSDSIAEYTSILKLLTPSAAAHVVSDPHPPPPPLTANNHSVPRLDRPA